MWWPSATEGMSHGRAVVFPLRPSWLTLTDFLNSGRSSDFPGAFFFSAKKARRIYAELLQYLSELRSIGETWIALPREVDAWRRLRNELRLVSEGGYWHIEGHGSERARVAYAVLAGDKLTYELDQLAQNPPVLQQARKAEVRS